ncbi:MAG: hypothetical protein LR017_00055 [Candidatus Pacebacteria bacterium]|nr:hypothetical protein [Candidatus Paceibacterota bacterium]
MSIQEKYRNSKSRAAESHSIIPYLRTYWREEHYIAVLLVFVALVSFALGQYSVRGIPIVTEHTAHHAQRIQIASSTTDTTPVHYVASKKGTKYHLPWCTGADRIHDANKVFFASQEAAIAAGYTPAGNCKGI